MLVLVLSACPPGLRGYLTRWLLEISAGVFVGRVSKRVRELLWKRTVEMVRSGRAIMVFTARNEQGFSFLVHGHHWSPVDIDGIRLMLRPAKRSSTSPTPINSETPPRTGWSKASKYRRYGGR